MPPRPRRKRRPRQPPMPYLDDVEVRRIQPYQADKLYLCPACNREIPPGTGHVVVVPTEAVDLRRHWHHGCWSRWEQDHDEKRTSE